MRLIPRRGYLMLFTGVVLGLMLFSLVSAIYMSRRGVGGVTAEMPSSIEITFLYSSEKQSWLEEVTPLFEAWFREKYGSEIRVNLVAAGSHESINLILQRSVKPTIWSPASNIWIDYLDKKWRETHGKGIVEFWTPLVVSPIVIAGWEDFAGQYNVSGFRDLYLMAKQGVDFKWGHPDPLLSNGGTMVVLLEFCEAAGKTPDELTVEDLTNETVLEFVRTIESKAVKYGKSTGFFGAWAADSGPSAITFFGVYENIVIDYSTRAKGKWGQRLIAIYPGFGTLLSDHPFVLLEADWVTTWQRFAALEYLNFLLSPGAQEKAQVHGFRPANPSVPISDIFSPENGVSHDLAVRILRPPKGEVIEMLMTVWAEVRNKGV